MVGKLFRQRTANLAAGEWVPALGDGLNSDFSRK